MAWLQVFLTTTLEKAPLYADFLNENGALTVTFQDAENKPIYEPALNTTPLWEKTEITALYEANYNLQTLKNLLQKNLDSDTFLTLKIEPLEDQNWTELWQKQFQPMDFGHNLWIYPSTTDIPKFDHSSNSINAIQLDPGMAFGTGTHPTTRLCLEWLAANPPKNFEVIDYGSGSGILGIAALKLGANFVYAVDYDYQALISSEQNAKQNGFNQTKLLALLPEQFKALHAKPVDLIVANILLNPLMELRDHFFSLLKPTGTLVVSGLLETQISVIIEYYKPFFRTKAFCVLEEWGRIEFSPLII